MKRILLLGLMVLMGLMGLHRVQAQTEDCPAGYSAVDTMLDGTGCNYYVPLGGNYYYSVSWAVYTRQELEALGITPGSQLREIGYKVSSTNGLTVYDVELYLKEVPQQALASSADTVPLGEMSLVCSTAQADFVQGWNYLPLDSTFTYTGYGHLMVAVKCGGIHTSDNLLRCFTTIEGRTARRYKTTQTSSNFGTAWHGNIRAAIAFRTCTPAWSCDTTAIVSAHAGGNSVQVVIGGGAQRQVALVPAGGNPDGSEARLVDATGDTVTFDSLDARTTYDIYARSLCGGYPSLWSTAAQVKTLCGMQTVPYTATLTSAAIDSCWVLHNVDAITSYIIAIDTDSYTYAVLPEMDRPVSQLHVQFRYGLEAGRSMVLGVMTDAYDTATFVPYDTLTAEYYSGNAYYDFDLNRWSGAEGRLAFRWTAGQLHWVKVDTVFGCYTPTFLTVSDVTTTSARLAWNSRSTTVTGFEVNLADRKQYLNPTTLSTDSTGLLLDSLLPGTYYSVQVRTRCGEGNTVGTADGVSQWSGWKQFCTECVTVSTLPYRLTSSQLGIADETTNPIAAPCWTYMPNVGGYYYWLLPEFDTTNIRMDQLKVTLSLRYNSDAPDVIGLGLVAGDSNPGNFAQIGAISMNGFNNYNVSTGKLVFYSNLRQGTRLAFRMLGNKIESIDSIVVEQVACAPVRDIVLTASTDTSMTIGWTEQGTATQWLVSLASQDSTYQQTFTATAKPFTVGGLAACTKYLVTVRALNYGDTSEARQAWFRTAVDTLHTFARMAVGNPSGASGNFNYPVYRGNAHSWQQILYPLSTQGKAGWIDTVWFYCVSPLSGTTLDTSLTLYLGHHDTTVARNTYDWVPMDELTQVYHAGTWRASAAGWVPIALDTPFLYNGTDALAVVFSHSNGSTRGNGDQYAYQSVASGVTLHRGNNSPDFATHPGHLAGTFESLRPVARFSIQAHTCAPVANMAATRLGLDTVQFSWTERGSASQWQVEYSADSTLLGDTVISGTPQLTFAGLPLDHTYRFRVRPVCAAGDTGYYSGYASIILDAPLPPVETLMITSSSLSAHFEVPINVMYADYGYENEFIYPADMLVGMEGSTIRGVQFRYSKPSFTFNEDFTLSMQVVADSTCTLNAWRHDSASLQQVWNGSVTIEDSLWTVWFDTPFTYDGGHLLFHSTTAGLTSGIYTSDAFLCLNSGDTAGRWHNANAQHVLQETYYTTLYLPAISFFYTLDSTFCHRPQHLAADSVWSTGAALRWDSMPGATGYQWEVTNGSWLVDSGSTTATTVTLTGLTVHENYTFSVSSLCDSVGVSAATTLTFFTPTDCSTLTLPYHEDFEEITPMACNVAGYLPDCWEGFNNSTFTYLVPHVITTGGYGYISDISDNALLMVSSGNSSSASGHTSTALLPRFAEPLSSLVLALDHRHENATHGTLTVGYYDEVLDTFHPVDTLAPQVGSYRRDTVSFSTVAETGVRMALQWNDNYSSYWGVAIDNIEVYTNNAPQMLTVTAVTPQCVSLRWAATDSATAYVVSLADVGDTTVSDTTVTLCGLTEGTDYSVGVAAIMGGDTSHYAHASFRTPLFCAPVLSTSAVVEGNNIVVGWQYDNTGYSTATGAVVTVTDLENGSVRTDTVLGATTALYAGTAYHRYAVGVQTLCGTASATGSHADTVQMPAGICYQVRGTRSESYRFINSYSSHNYNQMLYPATAVGSVDTLYGIAFRASGQTSIYTRATDIYLGHTTGTTLTSPVSADSLTQVADNYPYSIADTGWSSIMFDTPFVYDGTSNLIVTMVDVSGIDAPFSPGTGMHTPQTGEAYLYYSKIFTTDPTPDPYTLNFTAYSYSWIPDIQLLGGCNYDQCLSPEPMVTSTGASNITLAWTERGIEDLWQVEYRSDASNPWTVAGTTSATTYTLTGLTPATVYQLRVASLCSGDTLHSYILTNHTVCDTVQLPYHADFTLGTQPCWIEGGYYGDNFSGIRLYGLPAYYSHDSIVSPTIGSSLSDVKVTIRAQNPNNDSYYTNNSASLAVGACNADGSGIVWVDTVDFNERQVVEEHTVHFSHYSGTARNIIIRVLGAIADVESVNIDLFSGCLPVHDVRIAGLTDSEATVQWMPEDASHSFAVYLDGTLQGIASGTSYALTGLAANTQYTAAVREICATGDTAEAIACTFRTACTALSLPVFEDFDYAAIYDEEPGLPSCWTSLFYDHTANAYGIFSDGYYTCMRLNTSGYADSTVGNFAVSPLMNVGPGGAIVRFKGQTGWTGPVTVGVMTNVSDTATFIPCLTVTYNNHGLQWYQFSTDTLALPDVWAFAVRFGRDRTGIFDSLYVEANPVPTYSLSLAVNDTAMGTVNGSGTYEAGTIITISAVPNEGYRFVTWNDGVTEATRQVSLRSDTSLTAYFEALPDTVWYTVTVNTVMIDGHYDGLDEMVHGAGTYADGDTVTLEGEVHGCGICLAYWLTAEGDTIYENPYTFVIHSDVTLTAVFMLTGGIDEVSSGQWAVYPNPASTSVTVANEQWAAGSEQWTVELVDLNGRTVARHASHSSSLTIDISTLPRGVYFVRLVGNGTAKKLVVK